jgi:hypothetical protein
MELEQTAYVGRRLAQGSETNHYLTLHYSPFFPARTIMLRIKTAAVVLATGVSVLLGAPAESQAFFNWFGHHNRTTYRPVVVAQPVIAAPTACNSCQTVQRPCQPACTQTVQYVPQTCYRTVRVNTPVTTYRPVTSCDPCTGCPRTTMMPVTTMVQQCRRVPYTTYRPVAQQVCRPVSACSGACPTPCNSCNTVASYQPMSYSQPTGSCCNGSPSPAPAQMMAPSLSPTQAVPQPDLPAQGQTPQTFRKPVEETSMEADSKLQEIPKSGGDAQPYSSGLFKSPRLLDPQDRTTRLDTPRAYVQTAVYTVPIDRQEQLDAQGWRAAGR